MSAMLSICIPTYNRLKYLKELLPGLLAQIDAVPEGTVELVVSDNVSTDGTADYLKSIKRDYFRFWTNETNIGGDRNFLKCIREAKGDYVWLVGDDDLVAPDAVARVLQFIEERRPGLLIADTLSGSGEYADYRDYLVRECSRTADAALRHTLISSNIFLRSSFDMELAVRSLRTQYAHMFGLMGRMLERVIIEPGIVSARPVRADFAKYPSFLCVKQALYFWFLAKRFNLPRFRWYAFLNACNLPMEFGSRIKYHLLRVMK
ncbi:MAG: glycosyltransferase family 2 protein [bacterium]|nr:glycosyltransferase family 2 protein [Candidatus Colisoma equi]